MVLFVWSLYIFPKTAWISLVYSGFLPHPKSVQVHRLIGFNKIVNCPQCVVYDSAKYRVIASQCCLSGLWGLFPQCIYKVQTVIYAVFIFIALPVFLID